MDRIELFRAVQGTVFVLVALAAARLWVQHRSRSGGFLAGAFVLLGSVVLVARLTDDAEVPGIVGVALIAGLLLFPLLLAAFAWSFEGELPPWWWGAGVVTLGLIGWAFVVAPLPEGGQERSAAEQAFVVAVLVQWVALSGATAVHLWRAGRHQRLARARMRSLALGAVLLAALVLIAGTVPPERPLLAEAVTGASIVAALLFLVGFAPPEPLRVWWRQPRGNRLQEMAQALIAASTPAEVGEAVVPVAAEMLSGGALLVTSDGEVLARAGLRDQDADQLAHRLATGAPLAPDEHAVEVDSWWLAVRTSPYAPLFGERERDLLERFSLQLRLALERTSLVEADRQARETLERSADELQALLVGLAHDLRSPAFMLAGSAALLRGTDRPEDREQLLDGIEDGAAYLERLVDALLELSRVGRTRDEHRPVDLDRVIQGVRQRMAVTYPGVRVEADPLPTVVADPLRMEQVFDNLVGNAAKHGGRSDLTVTLRWHPDPSGGVLTVSDDGAGIDLRDRERIFVPFGRGATTAGGSGVGLPLVRRILRAEGGDLQLRDSPSGAHFDLILPVSMLVETPADAAGSTLTPGDATSR